MRADEIIKLLAVKHAEDVFVSECKDGPTHYHGHLRMDAWVMRKSWSKPLSTVYEVKVSRSDFLKDDKWRFYLPFCNEFYFVCPAGLIKPEECPPEAGLYYVSKTGTKLFIKKKSIHRDIQIPENLYRYILMCRVRIQREYTQQDKILYWTNWLAAKKEKQELGHEVSRRIRKLLEAAMDRAKDAEGLTRSYEEIKKRIIELGFDPDEPVRSWSVERALNELCGAIPEGLKWNVEQLIDHGGKVLKELQAIEKRRDSAKGGADGIQNQNPR